MSIVVGAAVCSLSLVACNVLLYAACSGVCCCLSFVGCGVAIAGCGLLLSLLLGVAVLWLVLVSVVFPRASVRSYLVALVYR